MSNKTFKVGLVVTHLPSMIETNKLKAELQPGTGVNVENHREEERGAQCEKKTERKKVREAAQQSEVDCCLFTPSWRSFREKVTSQRLSHETSKFSKMVLA
jgi:hypothetical protein